MFRVQHPSDNHVVPRPCLWCSISLIWKNMIFQATCVRASDGAASTRAFTYAVARWVCAVHTPPHGPLLTGRLAVTVGSHKHDPHLRLQTANWHVRSRFICLSEVLMFRQRCHLQAPVMAGTMGLSSTMAPQSPVVHELLSLQPYVLHQQFKTQHTCW